jgi:hypothetical protein
MSLEELQGRFADLFVRTEALVEYGREVLRQQFDVGPSGPEGRHLHWDRAKAVKQVPLAEFKDAPVVRRLKTKSRRRKPPNSDRVHALLGAPPTMPTTSQRPLPFDRSPLLLDD